MTQGRVVLALILPAICLSVSYLISTYAPTTRVVELSAYVGIPLAARCFGLGRCAAVGCIVLVAWFGTTRTYVSQVYSGKPYYVYTYDIAGVPVLDVTYRGYFDYELNKPSVPPRRASSYSMTRWGATFVALGLAAAFIPARAGRTSGSSAPVPVPPE